MEERRSYQRFNVSLSVVYRLAGWNEPYVSLCTNVGRNGICLIMNEALKKQTPLELEFAPLHHEFKKSIVIKGNVVWSREVSAKDDDYQKFFRESALPWKVSVKGSYVRGFSPVETYYETGIQLVDIDSYGWVQLFQYIPSIEMFDEQWSVDAKCGNCIHYKKIDDGKGTCFDIEVTGNKNPKDEQCKGKYFSERR